MTEEERLAKEAAEEKEAKEKAQKEKEEGEGKKKEKKTYTEKEYKEEVGKLVEERTDLKEKYRKARDDKKELEDRLDKFPSADEIDSLIKEKKELKEFKEKAEEAAEKKKLEDASEVEKIQIQFDKFKSLREVEEENRKTEFEKITSDFNEQLDKSNEKIKNLHNYKRDNEILVAAEKYKARNPQQIVRLLKDDLKLDDETEEYYYSSKDAKGKRVDMTVEEYVEQFLSQEDNDNLVNADVKGGTDTTKTKVEKKTKDSGMFGEHYMKSEKQIEEEEAEDRGLTVEEWRTIKSLKKETKESKLKITSD